MSGNYQKFGSPTISNTITSESVNASKASSRAGSSGVGNLFEDVKVLQKRIEALEKSNTELKQQFENLKKSCPHEPNPNPNPILLNK